jgi:alkylation response protein AidB-like acyl-CoA dehydrogenase
VPMISLASNATAGITAPTGRWLTSVSRRRGGGIEGWSQLKHYKQQQYQQRGYGSGITSIFNPTPEHAAFRETMRAFTEKEVEPQALLHNRIEEANWDLFHKLAKMGVLGLTVDPQYGGCGMDAVACVIMAEEISASDPSVAMTFGPHSNLFANNLNQNGNHEQRQRFLPSACAGTKIGGMCMSEPGGT